MSYKVETYGFRIVARSEFMAGPGIKPYGEDATVANAEQNELIVKRAAQIPGAFVLYDPSDDAEGFMLTGDDADELDRTGFLEFVDFGGKTETLYAVYKTEDLNQCWNIARGWVGVGDVYDLFLDHERRDFAMPEGGEWRLVA